MPEISPQSLIAAVQNGRSTPRGAPARSWVAHYANVAATQAGRAGAQAVAGHAGALGYVSDADLASYDAKVASEAGLVDSAVAKCGASLSAADQTLWQTTYAAWQTQHEKIQQALATSILGLGDAQMYTDLQKIEGQILAMQDHVHAACPSVIGSAGDTGASSLLTFVVVAAAIAAGVWLLSPVLTPALAAVGAHLVRKGSRHHE